MGVAQFLLGTQLEQTLIQGTLQVGRAVKQEWQGKDVQRWHGAAGVRAGHVDDIHVTARQGWQLLVAIEQLTGMEHVDLDATLAFFFHGLNEVLDGFPGVFVGRR